MTLSATLFHAAGLATIAGLLAFAVPAYGQGTSPAPGKLCVGLDCFSLDTVTKVGDSTLLLLDQVVRIKFADTSTNSNFPNNDWEIEINDNVDGAASYFGINDCGSESNLGGCGNNLVFAIEAGARNASLFVEADGDVGFGTFDPLVDLHIVGGNTPSVRLEQDSSQGFTPQAWDVGGNNDNFFIRDATGNSRLPFRILPGAASDTLAIGPNGVGIGLKDATELLHIRSLDGSGKLLVEVGSGDNEPAAPRFLAEFVNKGPSAVQIVDTSGAQSFWAFQSQAGASAGDASFLLTNSFGPGDEFVLQADGDLFITGTLTEGSDRNAKMAIVPVDPAEILAKVTALPVSAWTYKNDTSGARHLGPMAQDFHAIFGLGERDTGISTLDSSGVALAAIKALDARDADLALENATLTAQNKRLEALVADLAARLDKMEEALR